MQVVKPDSPIQNGYFVGDIDCNKSLTELMTSIGMDKQSLKSQLSVINHCFQQIHSLIDNKKDDVVRSNGKTIENSFQGNIYGKLNDLNSMANVFRCYALHRIDYYHNEKEQAILSLKSFTQTLFHWSRDRATTHLALVDNQCVVGKNSSPAAKQLKN
jgi:hypothetical protein